MRALIRDAMGQITNVYGQLDADFDAVGLSAPQPGKRRHRRLTRRQIRLKTAAHGDFYGSGRKHDLQGRARCGESRSRPCRLPEIHRRQNHEHENHDQNGLTRLP